MSDHYVRSLPGLDHARAALADQGYALTHEQEIGLAGFHEDLLKAYFHDDVLRHGAGELPLDRKRARDVIGYRWRGNRLRVREHETITITDRAGIPGKREPERVWFLDDSRAEEMVRTFLGLVPPNRRQPKGTFGVNLFRTFTNVVTTPHHDNEEFIILYVLDRVGDGAESYLYHPDDVADGQPTAEPVLRQQLNPGEIFIFEDKLFKHGATPLDPPPGGKAQRDVLVCTVDYQSTYLGELPPLDNEGVLVGSGGALSNDLLVPRLCDRRCLWSFQYLCGQTNDLNARSLGLWPALIRERAVVRGPIPPVWCKGGKRARVDSSAPA